MQIDLNRHSPHPTKEPDVQKKDPWKVKWEAEKEKLGRDAVKVLRFLGQVAKKMPVDPILIRRSQIIDAIREGADESETDLQERADLAMRNFGFEKRLAPESRNVIYVVPRKDVEDLCKAYAADFQRYGL